jgi:hypothetical protein
VFVAFAGIGHDRWRTAGSARAEAQFRCDFGDDIGVWNLSAYHRGMTGGKTPNLDKLAQQGAMFTDYYSQNSCTAGARRFSPGKARYAPAC